MPTLGTIFWVPMAIIIVIGGFWLAIKAARIWRKVHEDDHRRYTSESEDGWLLAGVIGFVVASIVLGGTLFGMWPYRWEYHHWTSVNGQVDRVSSRLLPNGDAVEQKFVVVLRGHAEPYGIQDTRAALLQPGDIVQLKCKKSYVYESQDGWDCHWNGGVPTDGWPGK